MQEPQPKTRTARRALERRIAHEFGRRQRDRARAVLPTLPPFMRPIGAEERGWIDALQRAHPIRSLTECQPVEPEFELAMADLGRVDPYLLGEQDHVPDEVALPLVVAPGLVVQPERLATALR